MHHVSPTSKGDHLLQELQQIRAKANGETPDKQKSETELSFGDAIDTLNPLQHIPGISTLYRELTGDEISGHARVMGGTLYGGPIGLVASGLEAAMAEESGKDVGEHVVAALSGEATSDGKTQTTAVAEAKASDANAATASSSAIDPKQAQSPAQSGTQATAAQPTATASGTAAANEVETAAAAGLLPSLSAVNEPASSPDQPANPTASESAQASDSEAVLKGNNALAAFARDMNTTGQPGGNGNTVAQANAAANSAGSNVQRGSAGQSDQDPIANQQARSDQNFMKLRASDYSTSAEMRARSGKLQKLQAEASNDVAPKVDTNSSRLDTENRSENRQIGGDGLPNDFASRMKTALEKYRSMHNGQQ